MSSLFVILAWNRMGLYSLLDNIPCDSKVLIFNLKWMNSNIDPRLITNKDISVINVNYHEDLLETLNDSLSNLDYTKVVLINPNRNIPLHGVIQTYIEKVDKKQIYSDKNFYVFWYDKSIMNDVKFRDTRISSIFSTFMIDLVNDLSYSIYPEKLEEEVIEQQKENIKYDVVIYSRCRDELFQTIKESEICKKLLPINFGRNNLNIKLESILNQSDEYILFVNHYSKSIKKCLEYVKEHDIKIDSLVTIKDTEGNKVHFISKKEFSKLGINNYYTDIEILKRIENESKIIDVLVEPKQLVSKQIRKPQKSIKIKPSFYNHFIFIIPFMKNGDRFHLFETTVKNLRWQIDNSDIDAEILIFECGKEKFLKKKFLNDYADQYIFQEYTDIFHRAWCFNVAARYCNIPAGKKTYFVLMDGDILVNEKWIDELKYLNDNVYIGWESLFDVSESCTRKITSSNTYPIMFGELEYRNQRFPDINAACGGITIIEKNVFFKIKGFPEYFKGTWGGEDNVLMRKLIAYKFPPKIYENSVYHLYHSHKTLRDDKIRSKWRTELKEWSDLEWVIETERIKGNWGIGKKVTIAMINYLREEKLIETLETIYKNTRLPLNIILQMQGREDLSEENKIKLLTALSKFNEYYIIWNEGNLGTAIPRYNTTNESLNMGSDYTIIIDSDMRVPDGTLELLFNKIESEPKYGAISCWCSPYYFRWKVEDNKLVKYTLDEGFVDTDTLGTGCVIIRTEVFNDVKFNNKLKIGYIDFIWCMDLKTKTDWKLGILCDKDHKIFNDSSKNSDKYNKARNNKAEFERSKQYAIKKFGIAL